MLQLTNHLTLLDFLSFLQMLAFMILTTAAFIVIYFDSSLMSFIAVISVFYYLVDAIIELVRYIERIGIISMVEANDCISGIDEWRLGCIIIFIATYFFLLLLEKYGE